MKFKILGLILAILISTQLTLAAPFNAKAKTKRIPAGTKLTLKLLNGLTTRGVEGADFQAMLITDQTADADVILPMGSMVRGNINKIVPAKRMSKGAILYLDFDHVVTPNGRQLPLTLNIIGRTDLTYDGGITTTKGYGDAFKQTCKKSGEITKNSVQWGIDSGDDYWNGYLKVLTVPAGAVGGALGTTGYFLYDTVADLIRKGKDVYLNQGDVLQVILIDPIDVPVM